LHTEQREVDVRGELGIASRFADYFAL
jgi:hypothetical protein